MLRQKCLRHGNGILHQSKLQWRQLHSSDARWKDPRMRKDSSESSESSEFIEDKFATLQDHYDTPKNPIILAHGLLGFDELRLAGQNLPGIQYWRGIREALAAKGVEVITAAVPPSGSIEARAAKLGENIAQRAGGKSVNIIGHSMGGLDARHMISQLRPKNVNVLSLTTIASPHRGSAFADYLFDSIGPAYIPKLYKVMGRFGLETGAFSQLTIKYMTQEFNPKTPDVDGIRYYSYGASLEPSIWSVFKPSHDIIKQMEGDLNDGLVSVHSSKWGKYQGTLVGVSHLDLINWTNRLKWYIWELTGGKRTFNAIALYLHIADMLAKEGL